MCKIADFKRGIIAGIITGIIYVTISAILAAIDPEFLYITDIYAAGLTPFMLAVDSFVVTALFNHVVRGIIFGAVFAALYSFVPRGSSIAKGMVLSLFFWVVTVIDVIYRTPGWPTDETVTGGIYYYGGTISLSSLTLALAGIISALVFGTLTGLLWDRLRGKKLPEERKGRSVLLVSFILGGAIWTVLTVGFLTGVLTFGGPVIEPGPFWWQSILCVSVVFLGLPGWALALDAWRNTKRREPGLKLGVAGGVTMALTGIMLLPGALAIIGGVLSRRKPAIEAGVGAVEQLR
jgi:hypothetical protein